MKSLTKMKIKCKKHGTQDLISTLKGKLYCEKCLVEKEKIEAKEEKERLEKENKKANEEMKNMIIDSFRVTSIMVFLSYIISPPSRIAPRICSIILFFLVSFILSIIYSITNNSKEKEGLDNGI